MAKKKESVKPKSTMDMTWDELFAEKQEHDNFNMALYGKPTREFKVGEEIIYGNLKNVKIAHVYDDGIYAIEVMYTSDARYTPPAPERRIKKWIDLDKKGIPQTAKPFTNDEYRVPNFSQSDMSSLIHMNTHNGYVMDTRFQRGYVWTQSDKEALIETIFNHGTIGSFLFNRHFGYNFKNSDEVNEFRTMTGETVLIPKKDNFSISVIDGQQRLTTLMNFYLNRWAYKGLFYSELSWKDKSTFQRMRVSYALVDESEGWALKDWVWLFLQANKGVSQSREHLVKMEEYYKGL
jgi:hypothetical protein